eukprot:2382033-Karenia_brevis.AAC.1
MMMNDDDDDDDEMNHDDDDDDSDRLAGRVRLAQYSGQCVSMLQCGGIWQPTRSPTNYDASDYSQPFIRFILFIS